jgi:transcriptional regulator with XRE-family HTH domain
VRRKATKPTRQSTKRGKAYRDEAGIKRFGEKMREIRKAKKITQVELSHTTGFEVKQIGLIERGQIDTGLSHVYRIAEGLGVQAYELFMPLGTTNSDKGE